MHFQFLSGFNDENCTRFLEPFLKLIFWQRPMLHASVLADALWSPSVGSRHPKPMSGNSCSLQYVTQCSSLFPRLKQGTFTSVFKPFDKGDLNSINSFAIADKFWPLKETLVLWVPQPCSHLTALSCCTESLSLLLVRRLQNPLLAMVQFIPWFIVWSPPDRMHTCGTSATVNFHLLFLNLLNYWAVRPLVLWSLHQMCMLLELVKINQGEALCKIKRGSHRIPSPACSLEFTKTFPESKPFPF